LKTLADLIRGADNDEEIKFFFEILNETQNKIARENLTVSLAVSRGEIFVRDFAGTVTVAIPYSPKISAEFHDLLTVYYLYGNENFREMPDAKFINGEIIFATNHFSSFFVSEWVNPFADVFRNDWFYRDVRFAYANDIMTGTAQGVFAPNINLSRAMAVTLLWRFDGEPFAANNNFSDVEPGAWYANAVSWAKSNGIVSGYGNGIFAPADNVTREQFAVILHNFAAQSEMNISGGNFDYSDANLISSWAANAMRWANANGIITGRTATTLSPQGIVTRSEAAAMIQRFSDKKN
jgi:hypothetical protein